MTGRAWKQQWVNACWGSTGWLKIKYPTRQYAISSQPVVRFKNSWSCLILTLLWIQRYTMYPPHLIYTNTLPRKTITMKITIFIIVLVLKSNETWKFDILDCHSLLTVQNPVKTVHLKTRLKSPPPAFTQARSLLIKLSTALLMEFCGRSSHIVSSARQWYLVWVEMSCSVQAQLPDMVIKSLVSSS